MDVPLSELESAALYAIPFGVIVLDAQGKVRRINRPAAKQLGIQPEQILGKEFKDVPGGTGLNYLPKPADRRHRWTTKIADNVITLTAIAITDENQSEIGTLVLSVDVTNNWIASELLSIYFNDLMSPLGVIIGYSNLLLEGDDIVGHLTDTQREFISIISEQAQKIADMRQNYREEYERQRKDIFGE